MDRVIPIHEQVERPLSTVLPSQVVESLIKAASHRFIMNECICRRAGDCQSYPIDLGCIFLGEAVLSITPAMGRLVTEEEALAHARRCRELSLVHLVGHMKMDSVVFGAWPERKLLSICNCCPCCCVMKTIPDLPNQIGDRITRMPGVHVRVTDACVGCGLCTEGVCFVDAIQMDGRGALIGDACRGCGRCVDVSPQGAIELTVSDTEYVQKTIDRLRSAAQIEGSGD